MTSEKQNWRPGFVENWSTIMSKDIDTKVVALFSQQYTILE